MHKQIRAAIVPLVLCGLASVASAQEYCVTCTGPDAKYRCIIGGEPSLAARTSRGQLLCITELAQSGSHASCSVGRTTPEPCEGELRTVMFPSTDPVAPPLAEAPPEMAEPHGESPAPGGADIPPAPGAPSEEPPTVQDSADTSQPSGNPIGNAVTKTWNCLSSLFSDC